MNISEMVRTVLLEDKDDDARSSFKKMFTGSYSKGGGDEHIGDSPPTTGRYSKDQSDYQFSLKRPQGHAKKTKYAERGVAGAAGATILGGAAALAKERMTKTPETTKIVAKSFKDSVKDKVMEHPKAAMAAGAASALGAGYGAYKYLKNRKGKKK